MLEGSGNPLPSKPPASRRNALRWKAAAEMPSGQHEVDDHYLGVGATSGKHAFRRQCAVTQGKTITAAGQQPEEHEAG